MGGAKYKLLRMYQVYSITCCIDGFICSDYVRAETKGSVLPILKHRHWTRS
jgi:hypothetical protein